MPEYSIDGQRFYQCSICSLSFRYAVNRDNHETSHTHYDAREALGALETAREALNPVEVDRDDVAALIADPPFQPNSDRPFTYTCQYCNTAYYGADFRDACEVRCMTEQEERYHRLVAQPIDPPRPTDVYQCNECRSWHPDVRARQVCQLAHFRARQNKQAEQDNPEFNRELSIRQPRPEGL